MTRKRTKKPVPRPDAMNDIDRLMLQTVFIEMGIVPIMDPTMDMRRALATLSPEDARKARRKFRKLWRKAMKKDPYRGSHAYQRIAGKGKKVPSRNERHARKRLVLEQLWDERIGELVEKAKDPRK